MDMMAMTEDFIQTPAGDLPVRMRKLSAEVDVPSPSSSNGLCTVTVTASFASGTCKGYHYRGTCKHVKMVTAVLKGGAS